MSINTVIQQLKNIAAPEVKVEQNLVFDAASTNWEARIAAIAKAFNLDLLETTPQQYIFRYPGTSVINPTQLKVVLGAKPNQDAYHKLQSYVKFCLDQPNLINIQIFEHMMGTKAEQVVYKQVLTYRLAQITAFVQRLEQK